jgi:hypothetical protein
VNSNGCGTRLCLLLEDGVEAAAVHLRLEVFME